MDLWDFRFGEHEKPYTDRLAVHDGGGVTGGLEIQIDRMTFNTTLPKSVFSMEAPSDFTSVHLKDDNPEH